MLTQEINSLVVNSTSKCHQIELKSLVNASLYKPNEKLLQFQGSKILSNRGEAQFGKAKSTDFVLYKVTFMTSPNDAQYEATLKYDVKSNQFKAKTSDLSRINRYGDQSACIKNEYPHLSAYCQCRTSLGETKK